MSPGAELELTGRRAPTGTVATPGRLPAPEPVMVLMVAFGAVPPSR
jgi:hypothetical protein